jgi:hypothetical protein
MQFAKFPFAEAYARLQLHYTGCNAEGVEREGAERSGGWVGVGGAEEEHGKKLRAAFASSRAA